MLISKKTSCAGASSVPELSDDAPTPLVDAINDWLPSFDLLVSPQAGRPVEGFYIGLVLIPSVMMSPH